MIDMSRPNINFSKYQKKDIDELCRIYYLSDFDHKIDINCFNLLISLIGFSPLGVVPKNVESSINSFRVISHVERYTFSMEAISSLLEFPSDNVALQNVFEPLIHRVAPLTDGVGRMVLENGNLNFGKYKDVPLKSLIFRQRP